MLRISGNADKSIVIAALQAYCQPLIYDYDKEIRVDEDENHYHINSFTIGIPAFCNFIYDTLSEKNKSGKTSIKRSHNQCKHLIIFSGRYGTFRRLCNYMSK